ncbi:MAG: DUF4350 domain-containing protein [Myxococcales bacterium]|nr:DUF4350 domain-containing protein [Myxococcales bacterium]
MWLALLLLGVALSAPAVAATDYDPQSNAWNGLSQLESLASRVDVEIRHTRRLDFSTLKPSDALLLIYPKRELPAPALESFIRDGGRVIVADDFGRSEPFLRRFGLLRVRPPIRSSRSYQGIDDVPMLEIKGKHFLFSYIHTLIANHPAAYRDPKRRFTPLLAFLDPRELLLAERQLGRGRLIVLADPSMLINLMLEFDDNFQFAANLLLYPCNSRPCRIIVVQPDTAFSGSYVPRNVTKLESFSRVLKRGMAAINRRLRRLGDGPRDEWMLLFVSVVCFLGSLAVLLNWVFGRGIPRSFAFEQPWIRPLSEFEHSVAVLRENRESADFSLALLRLYYVLDATLRRLELGYRDERQREASTQKLARRGGTRATGEEILEGLRALANLTSMQQASSYRFVSRSDFDRIFRACRPLLGVFEDEPSRRKR